MTICRRGARWTCVRRRSFSTSRSACARRCALDTAMTSDAIALPAPQSASYVDAFVARLIPVVTIVVGIFVLWYGAAVWLNAPQVIERLGGRDAGWTAGELVSGTWSMAR